MLSPEEKLVFPGNFRVRVFRPAFDDVNRLFQKTRDKIEIRSHALKLQFWPSKNPEDSNGQLLDLDWTWIKALPNQHVGELRIDDVIGGQDNLRIIFFRGDPDVRVPLPIIWILQVMQKKRDDFTTGNIQNFRARRTLVVERFYKNREFE